jgi:hypothetical protein
MAAGDNAMTLKLNAAVATIAISLSMATACLAAGGFVDGTPTGDARDESWYREQHTAAKSNARSIVQQRAQQRADQRESRMASLAWYGMSASRPSTATTPFTSRYGHAWEMPGGRPYSWYPGYAWPNYVIYWR